VVRSTPRRYGDLSNGSRTRSPGSLFDVPPGRLTAAAKWLGQVLADGPVASARLKILASAAGIGSKSLERLPGGVCTHWKSAAFARRTPAA
jgi:hypothetical protein